jgi:sulfonate transport system substrate-binding protein
VATTDRVASRRREELSVKPLIAVALLFVMIDAASAQPDIRSPLPAPVKVKQGMLNVPALSPLWLLPEYVAKYNIQTEMVMFQRFADERTALASGDLDIAAFGPQDISLALGQGVKSLVGIAGVGSGNDCLIVRKGEDIKEWKALAQKTIGVGAGSISWLKFATSVQENGLDYGKLKIINVMGGGANYLKALQGKEIDMAVVWQPFCAQGIVDGYAQYPSIDHNRSKTVGGLISVLAVNRGFMEKNRDVVQRLVVGYVDVLKYAQANPQKWAHIYAEKAGLPEPVAAESIRITRLDWTLPLQSIKRISRFLSDNGVIARDVSAEIVQHYTYDFLSRATGKSAAELGQDQ